MPDREEDCPSCEGSGRITVPCIETKIAYHLMTNPTMGLGLAPAEVAELGQALGLTPPAAAAADPGPVPPEGGAWPS